MATDAGGTGGASFYMDSEQYYTGAVGTSWGVTRNPDGTASANSGTADVSGPITVQFTWVPDYPGDEPPLSVILTKEVSAQWRGQGQAPGTGSCANGLGDQPTGGTRPPNPTWYGAQTSSGTHYKAEPGGNVITVTLSPTAHIEGTGIVGATSQEDKTGGGSCTVKVRVSISPVELTLAGSTRKDSGEYAGDNILIGQGVTGILSAGATLTNHQWTIPGETFASFDIGPDQEWGHMVELSSDESSKPFPHWFWREAADSLTVQCSATATINGIVIGQVAAKRKIMVWKPFHTLYDVVANLSSYNPDPLTATSVKAGDPGSPGVEATAAVGTPHLFYALTPGQFFFVQLVNAHRTKNGGIFNPNLVTDVTQLMVGKMA